ncbi:ABC transporter substrate-binding protein [Undibacter mobilis]|uniref:ABC transporter permease n=1 Tax=Undibacter mobilis TaxID=2292256 RepID=A0A371B754_9BRAD|nr:ABC transporter substrate-binding protein [Undibacter mobilis]RDV03429.1 ABC transporter permease [Undibacter mobilis]
MRKKHLVLGAAIAALIGGDFVAPPAQAQDTIYVPLFTYRTGPFAGSGIPIANGMSDYLTMLNERDGGIGGVKLAIEECETGYDTKKGVECYEASKGKKPVITNPYSTGITLQLIPKAAVDKIPVLSMAYGLSASADGTNFPWVFNPPATYWDGASVFVKFAAQKEGGLDKLKGKKLGLVHLDAPYGKEPIPLLEALAKEYGFELKLYPVPASEMQNQSSLWLNVRRDRPDWIYLQGWGAMNPTAVKEAAKINFPMDRLIGVWWAGGDDDARPAGDGAKGYSSLDFHAVGTDFPVIKDIQKFVVDKGKSQVQKEKVGENLYNRGVYNSMLIAEAIRTAQKITGKKVVTGEDVRRGLEQLDITEARLKEMGAAGFASPVRTSCTDHNGHHKVFMATWDGTKWVKSSDWMEPMKDKVRPLIEAAAKAYVESNTGWPKRTEPCDKSS